MPTPPAFADGLGPHLPKIDTGLLTPTEAAFAYARCGIPIVPYDPHHGKGKSCWNLVHYRKLTTDPDQLKAWVSRFGLFEAIATSPNAIGCVVIDLDYPLLFPERFQRYLKDRTVPFVWTRPSVHRRKGHYWFSVPDGMMMPNCTFDWGEVLSTGKGVVLPPYDNSRWGPVDKQTPDQRIIVRAGEPPILPHELLAEIVAKGSGNSAGAGCVDGDDEREKVINAFCRKYRHTTKPEKLTGVTRLHEHCLRVGKPPHKATLQTLTAGLGEAKIGYIPAADVIESLRRRWGNRSHKEFEKLVYDCVKIVIATPDDVLRAKSDRKPGTDSRLT